jgi:hypothetical protein
MFSIFGLLVEFLVIAIADKISVDERFVVFLFILARARHNFTILGFVRDDGVGELHCDFLTVVADFYHDPNAFALRMGYAISNFEFYAAREAHVRTSANAFTDLSGMSQFVLLSFL